MKIRGIWHWLCLAILVLGTGGTTLDAAKVHSRDSLPVVDQPKLDVTIPSWARLPQTGNVASNPPPPGSVLSLQAPSKDGNRDPHLSASSLAAASNVIDVFTNTWSYSTLGLVYDSARDQVRYALESQSSTHNPTIYDVDAASHTLVYSVALSTQNSGWPWQIDNRDGAGYDFVQDTYFLPDYNGDLSYADDNIVEIDVDGTILNAWEMDDEVGSNDSSDGSEIDNIIDIAVVPGSPTRYFVAAAYDGNVVYEIELLRTGTWWTPSSWHTVATYTIPVWSSTNDNLGIDWDAEHEVLYHSSWDTTTLAITDLSMNPVTGVSPTFDCPGGGGYNSGVTAIEGSNPPEVWVTDFSSDQTTRCLTPFGGQSIETGWAKWVAGQPWDPSIDIQTQLSDTFQVMDVITAVQPFTLTESWDPDRLSLVDVVVSPPVGQIVLTPGMLDVVVPAGPPEVVTIEKVFHVEPCTWITTELIESLFIEGEPPFATRPVTITKLPPELWIDSTYQPEVYAGGIASFTLTYSNTGGYENDVWISNAFPITAPFVFADPFPDEVGPDGTWTRWNVGDLAQDDASNIDVYVLIAETVPTSSTIAIWDGIFDHVDVLRDQTEVLLHVNQENFGIIWEKRINGEPWHPGISITLETSQTVMIREVITVPALNGFSLFEEWNPDELALLPTWVIESNTPILSMTNTGPGLWNLDVPPVPSETVITVTKEFRVEPCTWPETILWETLIGGIEGIRTQPLIVHKQPPELWIDSFFDVNVYSSNETEFVLSYGNAGGLESQAWIYNIFPITAPFVRATPAPTAVDPDGLWARWDVGTLAMDEVGQITVAVAITSGLPPSTTIEIWDGIFNHVDELADETVIAYHVPPPTWEKRVNDVPWTDGTGIVAQTSDLFTVTDVISTRSVMAMVEHWNADHLALSEYTIEPEAGIILSDTGLLFWKFPGGAPGTITITKIFSVKPCTWTYTVLWEELWVEHIEWERRPVHVDKMPSDLWITSTNDTPLVLAGHETTFTLHYGNVGGLESRAWISNTFPAGAPFVRANPPPDGADPDGRWAWWDVGALATGEGGTIAVTVAISTALPPDTPVYIYDYIYDHVDVERGMTVITYTTSSPIYLPLVLRNYP